MSLTLLHQKILNGIWDDALIRLGNEDALEEVKTFHDDELPLHCALAHKAPIDLIEPLINAYPDSLTMKGKKGMLALHIAANHNASPEILDLIIRSYPEALDKEDDEGKNPRHYERVDEKKALSRPTSCWKTQMQRDISFDEREELINDLEEKYECLISLLKRQDTECTRLKSSYTDILPLVQNTIAKTENMMTETMESLMSIQNEIDAFVDNANGRMDTLQSSLVKRDKSSWKDKSSELETQIESFRKFKEVEIQLTKMKDETRECQTLIQGLRNKYTLDNAPALRE